MLLVLSPAKSLDFETPAHIQTATSLQFIKQSSVLIKLLKPLDASQLSELMGISDKLAQLNVARNCAWRAKPDPNQTKQAILAFDGDVYAGFDAKSLNLRELNRAQNVVRTLSGLYGIVRPLDLIQPYRLEMGTQLANAKGKDLYAFWGDTLAQHLNLELASHKTQFLINLASDEYFKAVSLKALQYPVIQPMFYEGKNGNYKIVSFFAKRARGVMARYVVQHKIEKPELLKDFTEEGYRYTEEKMGKHGVRQWVFERN